MFEKLANDIRDNEDVILLELNSAQGNTQDLKGYYYTDIDITTSVMRPSRTLNTIIDNL